MQTQQIIQSNVNILRITNLKKGDVFKMISDPSYGSPELHYAVVLDLFNSGEKTFIQILQYQASYSNVNASIKILKGTDDIAIFPASKEEVEKYFEDAIENLSKDILKKEEELEKTRTGLEKAKEFVSGELSKQLTVVEYESIPLLAN